MGFRTGGEGVRSWGAAEGEGLSGFEFVKRAAYGGGEVWFVKIFECKFLPGYETL